MSPLILVLLLAAALAALDPAGAAPQKPLDPARTHKIALLLQQTPEAPGRPITDRTTWDALAVNPAAAALVSHAAALARQPIPDQPDDLFLEFSRTGNRTHWQKVSGERRGRLNTLVLAECLENRGRFLSGIEEIIRALCAERTWVLPAHDAKLTNFRGEAIDIDLGSSALGWNMAIADSFLGSRLQPAVRDLLRENIRRRILEPYHQMITGQRTADWWLIGTNNWNAVCIAGVTGAALIELPEHEARAEVVAAAEHYTRYFLSGFTPDGYCSEGLGYWNYGFGHYVLLSETIRRATDGKLDLLALPEARMPSLFGARIAILDGVSPAFADCAVNARPAASLMYTINRRFGLGLKAYDSLAPQFSSLDEAALYDFPDTPPAPVIAAAGTAAPGESRLRDWFDQAGILIARPAPGSACRMGVALKGGNNAENHNHNDVGSYVVVCGERPVLLDPGPETYTARTFSRRRYESKLLNSFGHAVPLVAGKLQREGLEAHGQVLRTDFTPTVDTLEFEIASAYPVPALNSLKRAFVYSRAGEGSLKVTDRVDFKTPQKFGTALITLGSFKQQPDGSLLIFDTDSAVRVTIDTGGQPFTIDAEQIHEDAPVTPTRIGINLKQPVQTAAVAVTITPMAAAADRKLLRNGDFESGAFGWRIPPAGMASLATDRAASGTTSLRIADESDTAGSDISSANMRAEAGKNYTLRGKVYQVSGTGVGMYIRFFNASQEPVNAVDARGNIAPVGTVRGTPGRWNSFQVPFRAPTGAVSMELWIHSFNGALSTLYLDDLDITPS